MQPPQRASITVKGLPVSGGIVIGRVLVIDDSTRRVVRRTIKPEETKSEVARFDAAAKTAIADIGKVHDQAERDMGKEAAKIFTFHIGMLKDPTLLGHIRRQIESEKVTAEYAATHVLSRLADQFRQHKDPVFATKVNDIDDLTDRLMALLVTGSSNRIKGLTADAQTIIIARDLTPSQTVSFDRTKIMGFATDLGGMTSHTAIIAKALEIPAVVGCQTLLTKVLDGDLLVLDGDRGVVIINPDAAAIELYTKAIEHRLALQVQLTDQRDLPSITKDNIPVHLFGNIELPEEVNRVLASGGTGIGLYRTEYLYLTGDEEPNEGAHYRAYKRCVQLCAGRELVIRTMDLGADKYTQAQAEVPERNPFLGCRSIRYCLKNQGMFKKQLRAILRASADAMGTVKLMFPLISAIAELRQAKFIVNDVMEELDEEGLPYDKDIKIGMMVEVPSAAIQAETFARECDFFSIGTNDLVQYTLAVDRINERVANLYSPLHPAVIRLIRDVARAARRNKIPVSNCGEASGDLEFAMLLIGLDVTTLSVSASNIPQLKRFIRQLTKADCDKVARETLKLDSDVQVAAFIRDRARKLAPASFSDANGDT